MIEQTHGLEVEMMSVAALKPYARNPRQHSAKQIRQIADSIREFGFTNPVLIDADGGVIAGHGRLEAAKLLGVTQPRISDLMRGKIELFGLDTLVNMIGAAGLHVEMRISDAA